MSTPPFPGLPYGLQGLNTSSATLPSTAPYAPGSLNLPSTSLSGGIPPLQMNMPPGALPGTAPQSFAYQPGITYPGPHKQPSITPFTPPQLPYATSGGMPSVSQPMPSYQSPITGPYATNQIGYGIGSVGSFPSAPRSTDSVPLPYAGSTGLGQQAYSFGVGGSPALLLPSMLQHQARAFSQPFQQQQQQQQQQGTPMLLPQRSAPDLPRESDRPPLSARGSVHQQMASLHLRSYCQHWSGCRETADSNPAHYDECIHPCAYARFSDCPYKNDPGHRARFIHLCAMIDGCEDTRPDHMRSCRHKCPQGRRCTVNDREHRCMYVHECPQDNCAMVGDAAHMLDYVHTPRPSVVASPPAPLARTDSAAATAATTSTSAAAAAAAGAADLVLDAVDPTVPLPMCPRAQDCQQLNQSAHCARFCHPCQDGVLCTSNADPAHCRQWVHLCADGPSCTHTENALHTAQYLHMCADGAGCMLLLHNPQHASLFVHPCMEDGCANTDPLHRLCFTHPCASESQCTDFSDGLHLQLNEHDCPEAGTCAADQLNDAVAATQQDSDGMDMRLHAQVYRHQCNGQHSHCRQSPTHKLRFSHFRARDLTAAERAALTNPIVDWHHAPHHPVTVRMPDGSTRSGTLRGFQCQDDLALTRTDNLVVDLPDGTALMAPRTSVDDAAAGAPLEPPWVGKRVRLLRLNPQEQQVMDGLMNTLVADLPVTFTQLFDTLRQEGIVTFLIGGAVRDVLAGKTTINDMDCAFNCDHVAIKKVCDKHKWRVNVNAGGLVRIGNSWKDMYFEGKCLCGVNSDFVPLHTAHCTDATTGQPVRCRVSGSCIEDELLVRDFAANALYYEPLNKIVIDPSGTGAQDAANRILRPPVQPPQWTSWATGNPTKLMRYFVFVSRGYQPYSDKFETWLASQTRQLIACAQCAQSTLCCVHGQITQAEVRMRFNGMMKSDAAARASFLSVVDQIMGNDFLVHFQ